MKESLNRLSKFIQDLLDYTTLGRPNNKAALSDIYKKIVEANSKGYNSIFVLLRDERDLIHNYDLDTIKTSLINSGYFITNQDNSKSEADSIVYKISWGNDNSFYRKKPYNFIQTLDLNED